MQKVWNVDRASEWTTCRQQFLLQNELSEILKKTSSLGVYAI